MIDSGVLTNYTSDKDDVEAELEKMTVKSSVDQELAKLKAERDRRKSHIQKRLKQRRT
jgi:phage shock protein A